MFSSQKKNKAPPKNMAWKCKHIVWVFLLAFTHHQLIQRDPYRSSQNDLEIYSFSNVLNFLYRNFKLWVQMLYLLLFPSSFAEEASSKSYLTCFFKRQHMHCFIHAFIRRWMKINKHTNNQDLLGSLEISTSGRIFDSISPDNLFLFRKRTNLLSEDEPSFWKR